MLKSIVDFWLLANADQIIITVPSSFGFAARSLNLTGDVRHFAIVRDEWAGIVARRYGVELLDDVAVPTDTVFGGAWCSTVGWAGDLCITYNS